MYFHWLLFHVKIIALSVLQKFTGFIWYFDELFSFLQSDSAVCQPCHAIWIALGFYLLQGCKWQYETNTAAMLNTYLYCTNFFLIIIGMWERERDSITLLLSHVVRFVSFVLKWKLLRLQLQYTTNFQCYSLMICEAASVETNV